MTPLQIAQFGQRTNSVRNVATHDDIQERVIVKRAVRIALGKDPLDTSLIWDDLVRNFRKLRKAEKARFWEDVIYKLQQDML